MGNCLNDVLGPLDTSGIIISIRYKGSKDVKVINIS